MRKKSSLNGNERKKICKMFGGNAEISQIAKTLQRDTRTVKKAIQDINYVRKLVQIKDQRWYLTVNRGKLAEH